MKTNQFYVDSITDPNDRQFVMDLFNKAHEQETQELKSDLLNSGASGPLNAFSKMRLFEKSNHIDQMRLFRIMMRIETVVNLLNPFDKASTILTKAQDIVYNRTEEQSRNYGDIQESMERASRIATHILGQDISTDIIYWSIVAIKLSREGYKHKEDNLLDAVAYMSALNDHLENNKNK